jgi:molybdopterin-guanine dinucleotide biosynthesis protein B
VKRLAVAFSGPSNSGKTTLIEKISKKVSNKKKVAIIKHDPKDKAIFDKEGKDSFRFSKTGADVAVVSPTKTTLFLQKSSNLQTLIEHFGEFDLLMVEGLKGWELPRISIFRGEIEESYISVSKAIAIDDTIDPSTYNLPSSLDILNLNDIDEVIEWIEKNAKEV